MLTIKDLTFSYQNITVFDNTSFISYPHELTVIKGESGSGKTTLLDILALKHGHQFQIQFNNQDIDDTFIDSIYYMQQVPIFCHDLTVEDQWNLLKKMHHSDVPLDEYISRLGLEGLKKHYPSQLSGGEKLRVFLIDLFIVKPKIVLMDEPTASLDDDYKNIFIELLQELKKESYVIVASHDPHLFNQADRLYDIQHQKLHLVHEGSSMQENVVREEKKLGLAWLPYFLKMKIHHIFKEIFSCLFGALPIAICAFSMCMSINFLPMFNQETDTLKSNQALVYKAIDVRVPEYRDGVDSATCFPITQEEYNIIESTEHIQNITPKLLISSYVDEFASETIYPEFEIVQDDNVLYDYQERLDEFERNNIYDPSPFYIEGISKQDKERVSKVTFQEDTKGVYLNQELVNDLQLDEEVLKNSYVKIKIGVPIYNLSGASWVVYVSTTINGESEDDDMVPANLFVYEPQELLLPINGIITTDNGNNFVGRTLMKTMYMLDDELQKIIDNHEEVESKVIYYAYSEETFFYETDDPMKSVRTYIYTPWIPNAYIFEVDSIENMDSVVKELESLGFTVDYAYNDYQLFGDSVENVRNMIMVTGIAMTIFVSVLFYFIHFVKGKEEGELNDWIRSIGYHDKKSMLCIKSQKYVINIIMTAILSYIFLYIINRGYLQYQHQAFLVDYKIIIIIILISIVTQYCIPMVWEVYHYAVNKKS